MSQTELRNVAFSGHGGTGKTSLISTILYRTGMTSRLGKVDDGSTTTDFTDGEIQRKISMSVAAAHADHQDGTLFMIDTPGFGDFLPEGLAALQMADSAVVVLCGVGGVETNTIKVWEQLTTGVRPRLVVINKLDRENASFERSLESLRKAFGSGFVPIHLPIGKEEEFQGLVDLIRKKAFRYKDDESGEFEEMEIPAELGDTVSELRDQLIEAVAETNEELLEKWFEGEELEDAQIQSALLAGVRSSELYPVLAASALKNIGSSHLAEAIFQLLPPPDQVAPFEGRVPPGDESSETIHRAPSIEEPFSAFIFKTMLDPYAGRISLARVISGQYSPDQPLQITNKGSSDKASALALPLGKTQKPTNSIYAGQIVTFLKLKNAKTGDTLTSTDSPIVYPPFPYPAPVITFAIQPKTKADEDKISSALSKLAEEDPTLVVGRHPQTKEIQMSGVGQLHVETAVGRLQRRYGVGVELRPPRIPYRETVSGTADVRYRHKKQTGGAGQFGEVAIRVGPRGRGEGFEFLNKIVGGVIPGTFIPSVEKGVRGAMDAGPVAGFPVVDFQVELYDGKSHPVDSKDIAFQIAGSKAFKEAILKANPLLLEPIMDMRITVPEECMGDVMGDLNSRRGRVQGMESVAGRQVIRASAPQAEIMRYVSDLRSITGDRGYFELEFSHYEEVPAQLAAKVIEANRTEEE